MTRRLGMSIVYSIVNINPAKTRHLNPAKQRHYQVDAHHVAVGAGGTPRLWLVCFIWLVVEVQGLEQGSQFFQYLRGGVFQVAQEFGCELLD